MKEILIASVIFTIYYWSLNLCQTWLLRYGGRNQGKKRGTTQRIKRESANQFALRKNLVLRLGRSAALRKLASEGKTGTVDQPNRLGLLVRMGMVAVAAHRKSYTTNNNLTPLPSANSTSRMQGDDWTIAAAGAQRRRYIA